MYNKIDFKINNANQIYNSLLDIVNMLTTE